MNDTKRFFCLRGFMKSGTNWLGSLLDRHPSISCNGEYHWHLVLGPLIEKNPLMVTSRDPRYLRRTIARFRRTVQNAMIDHSDPSAELIGDRTPHTITPIVLKAPHVVIVRDGRDVLVSRAFHLFNQPSYTKIFQRSSEMKASLDRFQANKWHFKENPEELLGCHELVRDTARWWVNQLVSDRHVAESAQIPVQFVKYEDLHADTLAATNLLFDFLGVDPALAPPIEGHLSPGFSQENPDQFLRKGAVGDWVNYFTDETRETFKTEANQELIRLGYETGDAW